MPGPEHVLDLVIRFRTLVGIADDHADRHSGRPSLEDTAQHFDTVCLLARRRHSALSGPPAIKFMLDECCIDRHSRTYAIDDHSYRGSVALAESRDPKMLSKRITCHEIPFSSDDHDAVMLPQHHPVPETVFT
jgi:hypothetical protein